MMAAVTAKANAGCHAQAGLAKTAAHEDGADCEVFLFEKNAYLGAKVLISGGGRCNLTTGISDVKELLKNYPRGAKFLMTAMFRFPPEKVMEWFEAHGVPLKIEKDNRVFPKSNDSKDVVGALEKEMKKLGVEVLFGAAVSEISRAGNKFEIAIRGGRKFAADAVILTTGGNAYRHTGSTGDGYAFAEALGHTITKLRPSLSSFIVGEKWVKDIAGISFEKAKLKLSLSGKKSSCAAASLPGTEKLFERTGSFSFTHRGITGPAVFALSSMTAHEGIFTQNPAKLTIDFFPDEKPAAFEKRLQALILKNAKKTLANFLDVLLPKSLCGAVIGLLEIPEKTITGNLTKQNRGAIAQILKTFPLTVTERNAGEEFVTAGGVDLTEVNTNTMESKICPGLYFAGEILDVDAFTGGFNLQASWATGALAGSEAAAAGGVA